jgi:hypothetical protein
MPLNLASPGIRVREVDLTVGRVDPTSDKFGGIVAPFAQGPVQLDLRKICWIILENHMVMISTMSIGW